MECYVQPLPSLTESLLPAQTDDVLEMDELVSFVGEQRVASFSLAVNRKTSSGNQQTLWVRANAWKGLADVATKYARTGRLVQVSTEWLRPSAWIGQNGEPRSSLDLDTNRLILLDRVEANGHQPDEIPF